MIIRWIFPFRLDRHFRYAIIWEWVILFLSICHKIRLNCLFALQLGTSYHRLPLLRDNVAVNIIDDTVLVGLGFFFLFVVVTVVVILVIFVKVSEWVCFVPTIRLGLFAEVDFEINLIVNASVLVDGGFFFFLLLLLDLLTFVSSFAFFLFAEKTKHFFLLFHDHFDKSFFPGGALLF